MRAPACTLFALATAAAMGGDPGPAFLNLVSPSRVEVGVEFFTYVASSSASDTATVSGSIAIEADDYANPASITLLNLVLNITPPGGLLVEGTLNAGPFLGNGEYTFRLDGASLVSPPEGVPPLGTFNINLDLTGQSTAAYSILGLDTVPPENPTVFNLAALPAAQATLQIDSLTSNGATVTLVGTLTLSTYVIEFVPALVQQRVDAVFDITARGADPGDDGTGPRFCSRADIAEPCGVLDLQDILAFITGFSAQDPIADFAEPFGVFDLADIVSFVTIFNDNECQGLPGPYDCYYIGMNFDEGDASYALGEHHAFTAGIALAGSCLMLGLGAFRRRPA